jgi:hypothetical protein
MDATAQTEALQRMLAEARQLVAGGDPLLQGLYMTLVARLEMLLSLLDAEAGPES